MLCKWHLGNSKMTKGKSIAKQLLRSSESALFAGIEIHNKPHFDYRYATATTLIVNAWELALKAYIYKHIDKKLIYEKGTKHTKAFLKVLSLVYEHITGQEKNKSFSAVYENLRLLNRYRNSYIHFVETELDPVIFMLISKAVMNYDTFMKKYFKNDITKDDNLVILPIGMKLPFNPISYLRQDYAKAHNDFVDEVVNSIRELNENKIQESVVIGFDVYADCVRDMSNADILKGVENSKKGVPFCNAIRITDDPNAPEVRVVPNLPPLSYKELRLRAKEKKPDIKFGPTFNKAMRKIKVNPKLCKSNYLDPKKKTGTKKDFYTISAVDMLIEEYQVLEQSR